MKRIIGVNSNSYHGYSIEDALEGISSAGFQYVELTATKGWTEHVFPTMSFEYLIRIKERMKDLSLVPFAMSGHCNLMDKARLDDFILNIKLAAFFGCDFIVSSIGEAHLKDKEHTSNEVVADHIRSLVPYLREYGMQLDLETHGEHGTGAILKEIVQLIDSPYVSINYDTANVLFYGDVNIKDDLTGCVDSIGFMHLKDKAGEKKEWNFPALGEGYVDFPEIIGILEEESNNCPFSIEIEFTKDGPKDLNEINRAVQNSYHYLKSIGCEL